MLIFFRANPVTVTDSEIPGRHLGCHHHTFLTFLEFSFVFSRGKQRTAWSACSGVKSRWQCPEGDTAPPPHFQTQNSEAQRGELQQRCPCSQLAHLRTAATGTGTRENQEKEDVEVASWALGTTQKTLPWYRASVTVNQLWDYAEHGNFTSHLVWPGRKRLSYSLACSKSNALLIFEIFFSILLYLGF